MPQNCVFLSVVDRCSCGVTALYPHIVSMQSGAISVCIQFPSTGNSAALSVLYRILQAPVKGESPQRIDVGVDLWGRTVACAPLPGRANFPRERFLCKAVSTLLAVNEVSQLYTFLATLEFVGLLKFFHWVGSTWALIVVEQVYV